MAKAPAGRSKASSTHACLKPAHPRTRLPFLAAFPLASGSAVSVAAVRILSVAPVVQLSRRRLRLEGAVAASEGEACDWEGALACAFVLAGSIGLALVARRLA